MIVWYIGVAITQTPSTVNISEVATMRAIFDTAGIEKGDEAIAVVWSYKNDAIYTYNK